MTHRLICALCLFISVIAYSSCKRDDDEPAGDKSISRLYISYSEYRPNDNNNPIKNIDILSRSDSADFGSYIFSSMSPANGGAAIYFHPAAQKVFQTSQNALQRDSIVYSMQVGLSGLLEKTQTIFNIRFEKPTSVVYHPFLDKLYVIQSLNAVPNVFVFNMPRGISGSAKTSQRFTMPSNSTYWDATVVQSALVLSRNGINGGLDIFENLITQRDTLVDVAEPTRSLTITGANNIRGFSVDTVNNMLAVADYVDNGAGQSTGRILIFDNYSELSKTTGTINPTRIISGSNTKLTTPYDVDLDFRKDSKYLYVADPGSKAVYRFLKSDNGNVAPNATYSRGLSPVSLSLDARQ